MVVVCIPWGCVVTCRGACRGCCCLLHSKRCGCSSMAECELPKLETGVRFPSPAFGAGRTSRFARGPAPSSRSERPHGRLPLSRAGSGVALLPCARHRLRSGGFTAPETRLNSDCKFQIAIGHSLPPRADGAQWYRVRYPSSSLRSEEAALPRCVGW